VQKFYEEIRQAKEGIKPPITRIKPNMKDTISKDKALTKDVLVQVRFPPVNALLVSRIHRLCLPPPHVNFPDLEFPVVGWYLSEHLRES